MCDVWPHVLYAHAFPFEGTGGGNVASRFQICSSSVVGTWNCHQSILTTVLPNVSPFCISRYASRALPSDVQSPPTNVPKVPSDK